MATKETGSFKILLKILEARFAVQVIWALRDGHSQTFRLLQDSVGTITPNTLNTRLKSLRDAGLLSHNGKGYLLTVLGKNLVSSLDSLHSFSTKWGKNQPASSKSSTPASKKSAAKTKKR